MAIEKIGFSYPAGYTPMTLNTSPTTLEELAAITANKVDECIDQVNGVEQSAIEARAIVDDMHIQQEDFVLDNADTRAQLITDNQTYLDTMRTSASQYQTDLNNAKTAFETSLNASKTTFETGMTNDLNTFKTDTATAKTDYEASLNTSKTNFEASLNTSKTTFETDMTNSLNTFKADTTTAKTNFETSLNTSKDAFVASANQVLADMNNSADNIETVTVPQKVNEKIASMVSNGEFDTIINQELFSGFTTDITTIKANIKDISINLRDFGGHATRETGFENFDNHGAIISALDYAKANKISTILFPSGTIKTAPISFQNYNNIIIEGSASSYYSDFTDQYGTIIQIISAGDVGLQFSSTINPAPAWQSHSCKVKNIKLDCNNMVRCGINGNFDFTLENVAVVNALEDGITLEDYTYPAKLKNVMATYNGRHGFYARGSMSTVYTLENCEFSRNHGYGMLIEGGHGSSFKDCMVQANHQGGIKISKVNLKYPTTDYYLSQLLFSNFYTEANGTLPTNDPNYEGNFAVYITSDQLDGSLNHRALAIKFSDSSIFKSTNGGDLKIDAVYGLEFDNVSIPFNSTSIPTPQYCSMMICSPAPSIADSKAIAPFPFLASYGTITNDGTPALIYKGGIVGSRGRSQLLQFYLPSIQANETLKMSPLHSLGTTLPKGFPLFGHASILAIQIFAKGGVSRFGTLTATVKYGYKDDFADPTLGLARIPETVFNVTNGQVVTQNFTPFAQYLDTSFIIGVDLTASSDYALQGSDNTSILVNMVIEC